MIAVYAKSGVFTDSAPDAHSTMLCMASLPRERRRIEVADSGNPDSSPAKRMRGSAGFAKEAPC